MTVLFVFKHMINSVLGNLNSYDKKRIILSGDTLWTTVADVLKCRKVARKSNVKDDGFRTPQVELLLGGSSWITHIDNGIRFDKEFFPAGKYCRFG